MNLQTISISILLVGVGIAIGLTYPVLTADVDQPAPPAQQDRENQPENDTISNTENDNQTDSESAAANTTEPQPDEPAPQYEPALPQDVAQERRLEQADSFLAVGNYRGAFKSYRQLSTESIGQTPARLALKTALSAEFAGDLSEAEPLYLSQVRNGNRESVDRLAALIGLARIWKELDRDQEALELLHELFLTVGTNGGVPSEIRMQILNQISLLNLKLLAAEFPLLHRELHEIEFLKTGPDLNTTVTLPTTFRIPDMKMEPGQSIRLTLLQRPNDDAQLIAIDAISDFLPTLDVLNEIASKASLKFDWTEQARSTLLARSTKLSVQEVSLALTMDSILVPLEIGWLQEEDQIELFHWSEDPQRTVQFQMEHSLRQLRLIELTFPRNLRRNAGLMHQGNLMFVNRDYEAASARFKELRQVKPGGELSAKLNYNLGKLAFVMKRPEEAARHFMRAVDQSESYRLQAKGYSWVARSEFIQSNFAPSVNAATRSLRLAQDPFLREDTVMRLAKCYLLDNNPYSANKVLFDFRDDILSTSAKRMAAMLGAFSRYLAMTPVDGLRNEGERLIVALIALRPDDYLSFTDQLLVGRAFFEIGLKDKAMEVLQQAMETTDLTYWRRRIAFELGMLRHRAGELESAITAFQEVAQDSSDEPGILAKLRLAQIALTTKKYTLALRHCNEIIELRVKLSEDVRGSVLNVMGRAYRSLGRNHAAAVCFAGMYPDKEQFESDDTSDQ